MYQEDVDPPQNGSYPPLEGGLFKAQLAKFRATTMKAQSVKAKSSERQSPKFDKILW